LVWFGATWWLPGRKDAEVLTAVASRGDLVITVSDRGELESSQSVQMLCEVEGGGKLVTIVPEGTPVKKGDEVAVFDTDALQKGINEQEVKWEQAEGKEQSARGELEVQKNKAEGEIAKADLAFILAKIDLEAYEDEEGEYKVELDKREAALSLARKEEKEAEDNLDFNRSLVKKGFAQLEQMRAIELNMEAKRFAAQQLAADLTMFKKFTKLRKLTELRAKAEDAKRELERTRKSQAAATQKAENELQAAQKTAALERGQLARLRRQLDKCVVMAPMDGIVIYYKERWDDSARVRPGGALHYQQPIFSLPDLNNMQVKVKVHESVVKKVHLKQSATMQVEALPNQVLHGKVLEVSTVAQSDGWRGGGVKEYETEVSIDDLPTDAGLRPGMTAEVKILVKTVKDALLVPVQAVTESGGKQVCYVVKPSGIERREVEVGEANEQYVQILEGVAEGEPVALDARGRAAAEVKAEEAKNGPKKDATKDKISGKEQSSPGD
jgi:HlyD family secretion protein